MIKFFFSKVSYLITKIKQLDTSILEIIASIELLKNSIGRIEYRQLSKIKSNNLNDYEFQVHSQWGEDGIIQFLINNISIDNKIFVEFGVEDYRQANTRFLLVNNNWTGLVIDGSPENILKIKKDKLYWNYNLKAVCSFISKKNINDIFIENGLVGEIGLLSIDIDGNDYWIWEAITIINPVIVIVEYNYRFGINFAVTVPYDETFERLKVHHSMIYFGSSLKALLLLANKKGYSFIGCCQNGVNAFFVRSDKINSMVHEISLEQGYKAGKFCEYRDEDGTQERKSPEEEIKILEDLNLPLTHIKEI